MDLFFNFLAKFEHFVRKNSILVFQSRRKIVSLAIFTKCLYFCFPNQLLSYECITYNENVSMLVIWTGSSSFLLHNWFNFGDKSEPRRDLGHLQFYLYGRKLNTKFFKNIKNFPRKCLRLHVLRCSSHFWLVKFVSSIHYLKMFQEILRWVSFRMLFTRWISQNACAKCDWESPLKMLLKCFFEVLYNLVRPVPNCRNRHIPPADNLRQIEKYVLQRKWKTWNCL